MPLTRKLIKIGDSRGITIPQSWINYIERKTGKRIIEVAIEVNGVLKISPIIEKEVFSSNES